MTEKHLSPLDLTVPASQVADRRRKWKCAFEYYGQGASTNFGMEDLQDPGPIPGVGDSAYKVTIGNLDFYFRVEKNIPYERHVFRQLPLQGWGGGGGCAGEIAASLWYT